MAELADGDHRVRELAALLDQPQNLVSYHLRLLRDGGLVTATRSSLDGRDSYYHLDLDRCADELTDAGSALHPALRRDAARPAPLDGSRPVSVLFVCTGNAARSPLAEALLRHRTAGRVAVASAGSRPRSCLHPHTVRVLREDFGVDVSGARPRHLDTLAGQVFDHVITLCDKAREVCPEFGPASRRAHWSVAEPSTDDKTEEAGYAEFQRTASDIETRVRHLQAVLAAPDRQEIVS